MTPAEDYLLLGLRLGKHVEGLVDAYYGPQDLQDVVDDEPIVPSEELARDGADLRDSLEDGWLRDQVSALATYARVLAGEAISYSDEVEGCYGVRPARTPEAVYEEAHATLDELLPGAGSLAQRREAWRERYRVEGPKAVEVIGELVPFFRERTRALLDLPDGEQVSLDAVHDEPWWAFNYYLGDLRSRVVLNTDVPTGGDDLLHLVAHEVYPGHHTEHAVKEQVLMRDRGLLEEGIQLVPTPQAVLSEGIAETGSAFVLDGDGRREAYEILRRAGLTLPDPDLAERIRSAGEALSSVSLNAALMIHEGGASADEAAEYVARWSLRPLEQARRSVDFVTDPTWRAYTITYDAGRSLCRAYTRGDPARFRTLLTEHVRVGELLSA